MSTPGSTTKFNLNRELAKHLYAFKKPHEERTEEEVAALVRIISHFPLFSNTDTPAADLESDIMKFLSRHP